MPIIPTSLGYQFDTVNAAMNLARVRLLDAYASLGGEIFTDGAPFSQTIVNGAWRVFQKYLANLGCKRWIGDRIITGISPVSASLDPAQQVYMDWFYYFDGASLHPTPHLWPDFISPIKCWERQSGTNMPFPLHPNMQNMLDGLPSRFNSQYGNRFWEWRENKLFMPGSLIATDMRIRFAINLGDFETVGDPTTTGTYWYNQPIPIANCLSPFSKFIAYEVDQARGGPGAATFKAEGEAEAKLIWNDEVRASQRVNTRRRSRSGRDGTYGYNF